MPDISPVSDLGSNNSLENGNESIRVIHSQPSKQEFWKEKRIAKSKELEDMYAKIAPGIPLVNVQFDTLFLNKCKEYFEDLVKENSHIMELERWDEYEINRMFGKGLNPTSLKTEQDDIKYFVSRLNVSGDTVTVIEYGPGSGWSTVMLFNELKNRFPNSKIRILSIDLSPHSIVATQNTLDYTQIPWQTVLGSVDYKKIPDIDDKITLMIGGFVEISKAQEANTFDGFFSSHGTAYLSELQYLDLFNTIKNIGKNQSVFVTESLDPLYTVSLDTMHLVYCSMFPNRVINLPEYVYGKSLRSNSKFFPGQEVKKLVQVHNGESNLFYRWNNYLIKKLRIGYLLQMLKSIKITTDVIEEYREDVYPSYLVHSLLQKNMLTMFEYQDDKPKCPLYITNTAFILHKNEQ